MPSAVMVSRWCPKGTPTNNTEAANSGHGREEDSDESFDALRSSLYTPTTNWLEKRDGQWLAEFLGLDRPIFAYIEECLRHDGFKQEGAQ
ncbi:MAG: hypothetical protein QM784_01150 [Polyangiaceae bacterium]